MKNIFPALMILSILIAATSSYGEVYSWVDKDGKKNFGEKVPKEYLKQSTALDVKPVNSMDAAEVPRKPTAIETSNQPQQGFAPPPAERLSSCEQQKLAYAQSVKCYASCRQTEGGFNGRTVNNVANCHCVDVKKPNC